MVRIPKKKTFSKKNLVKYQLFTAQSDRKMCKVEEFFALFFSLSVSLNIHIFEKKNYLFLCTTGWNVSFCKLIFAQFVLCSVGLPVK